MADPRHRRTGDLTLGFLTLGAHAAPLDVIDAAAEAGFGAVGPRISGRYPGDPWPPVDGVRDAAAAKGVRISSATGYYISPQVRAEHLLANVEAARAIGAPMIMQSSFEPDRARFVSLLRDYAMAAADAGLKIAIEFMPMSEVKTIAQALSAIEETGADNLGLLVDTLHLARSGGTSADVAALDPSRIYLTQLCDAPAQLPAGTTIFDEAMAGRMYLGTGGLDLASVVRALPPGAEIELETPVVADAALPPAQRARRAAEAAQRFFARHFG